MMSFKEPNKTRYRSLMAARLMKKTTLKEDTPKQAISYRSWNLPCKPLKTVHKEVVGRENDFQQTHSVLQLFQEPILKL